MSLLASVNEAARGEPYLTPTPMVSVATILTTIGAGFTTSAAIVYTAGSVTNKLTTARFIPSQSGNHVVQLGLDTGGINWNGGSNSSVNLQVTDLSAGNFTFPLYIYSSIPSLLASSSPVMYLQKDVTYALELQVNAVAQNVDLTGAGANRVYANFNLA